MSISLKDEYDGIYDASAFGSLSENNIYIRCTLNKDPEKIYFKVYNEAFTDKCARISIMSPQYIDDSLFLSNDEIDSMIKILESNWHILLYYINCIRSERNFYNINKINMPDYNDLKNK